MNEPLREMVVVAFDVTGMTQEQKDAVLGEAFAQGEESERHPDVNATFSTHASIAVRDDAELRGILEVGAGL